MSEIINAVAARRQAAHEEEVARKLKQEQEEKLIKRAVERQNYTKVEACKKILERNVVPLLKELNVDSLRGRGQIEVDLLPFQECGHLEEGGGVGDSPRYDYWVTDHPHHPGARAELIWYRYSKEKSFAFGIRRKKTGLVVCVEAAFTTSDKVSFEIGVARFDPLDPLSYWAKRENEIETTNHHINCPDSLPSHPRILSVFREDPSLEPPFIEGPVKWCEIDPLAQIDNEKFGIDFKIALAWAFLRASS